MKKNDHEIWKAFKEGDEEAFSYLYDTYFSILYVYGRNFSANPQLIMDCVQDLFLELIKRRNKLADTDNIRFYLMRSMRRRIARKLKKGSARFEQKVLDDPEIFVKAPPVPDQDFHWKKEEMNKLKGAIKELPERQKEVIYLKYYFDFTNSEIAGIMDINYQSVSNHLQKAIKRITNKLIP